MTTLDIKAEVDAQELEWFIEFLTVDPDVFSTDYIGYWAYGIGKAKGGWVLHTDTENVEQTPEELKAILESFNATGNLPPEFKHIDRTVALEIAKKHIELNGSLDYDAGSIDVAIQTVVLGEVVYG